MPADSKVTLSPSRGHVDTYSKPNKSGAESISDKFNLKLLVHHWLLLFIKVTMSLLSVCFLQWAFCRAGQRCCSAGDIERRNPASANPMKTSQTWAITLLLLQPSPVKSPAVSLGVSSSASLSAHQANQKAKALPPTEERARWITDYQWPHPNSTGLF